MAAQICKSGYSSSVRDVPAEVSRMVYADYGIGARSPGEYEVDHLVPLELGGSDDIANLWPQAAAPPPGFHEKDQVEKFLHAQVCGGGTNLIDAHRAIATNWIDVYQHLPQRASATTRLLSIGRRVLLRHPGRRFHSIPVGVSVATQRRRARFQNLAYLS
jgi:hypothetical protein